MTQPLYLEPGLYLPAPLQETYQRTWDKYPAEMKEIVACPDTATEDAGS